MDQFHLTLFVSALICVAIIVAVLAGSRRNHRELKGSWKTETVRDPRWGIVTWER